MTDAHQSPLICLPLKTTEEVDLGSAVRSIIVNSYGEDPSNHADQTVQLNRARQDAIRGAASDATGRDLLYKWFHMLEMLELRFPELRVPFPWKDAFTQKPISQSSLAYEKASVIFNIAATLSSLAASQPRLSGNPDGVKRAYAALRQSAGMLSYINENFLHAPSTDMSKDVVKCLVALMLAQASEVFLEKSIEEKKNNGLVSKLASQTAAAYTSLVDETKEFVTKGVFDRSWLNLIQAKAKHYSSITQYYRALADDASGSHGSCLVRLTSAESLAKEAQRLAGTFSAFFNSNSSGSRPTIPSDAATALSGIVSAHLSICSERKATAVKDNDLIYHDILPSESTLPPVDKLVAATPVSIQDIFAAPEVQRVIGPDLFQKLVPLGVHESASLYSEEKAKIARAESERHDLANGELQAALDYMGLPASLKKFRGIGKGSGDSALDALADPGAEVMRWSEEEASGGGGRGADGLGTSTESVDSALQRIASLRSQASAELESAATALDECEKQRVKYGHRWTQDPAGLHTKDMRSTIKENREALQQATANDQRIQELWESIRADIGLLVSGRDALEGAFAAAISGSNSKAAAQDSLIDTTEEDEQASATDASEVQAKLSQIDERLVKLQKIKRERGDVLSDLKEKIQTDDISQVLVLNRRAQNVEPAIFAAELEKFKAHQNRIAVSLHHQQALLGEVTQLYKELGGLKAARDAGRRWDEKAKARAALVARLRRARESHAEVRAAVARGLQFYADLGDITRVVKQNATRYAGDRRAERDKLIAQLEWDAKLDTTADSMGDMRIAPQSQPQPQPQPQRQASYGSYEQNYSSPAPAPAPAPAPYGYPQQRYTQPAPTSPSYPAPPPQQPSYTRSPPPSQSPYSPSYQAQPPAPAPYLGQSYPSPPQPQAYSNPSLPPPPPQFQSQFRAPPPLPQQQQQQHSGAYPPPPQQQYQHQQYQQHQPYGGPPPPPLPPQTQQPGWPPRSPY